MLGEEFPLVHKWLDELAHRPRHDRNGWMVEPSHTGPLNPGHRKYRHTLEGVEHVRATWGDEAALAAILHIKDDIYGPCPHTDRQTIPKDTKEYQDWGMV